MKIQARHGVFETNSSSIHALCVPTDKSYTIPDYVSFYLKCYGWDPDKEDCPGNYLYTALACLEDNNRIRQLEDILYKHGVKHVEFEPFKSKDVYTHFYIDHVDECLNWIDSLFKNEEKLLRHLFTPGAVIYITNDNSPDDEIMGAIGHAKQRDEEVVYLG